MRRKTLAIVGIVALPLLALGLSVGAARLSHRAVEVGLVDGRLRPCPSSSNCVCSEPGNGDASIPPLSFAGDPEPAFRSLVDFLRAEARAEIVTESDDYVHAVFYTPYLKFADDVELRLDADAQVVHVRSESRIGRSDLGTNRARIETLRERWVPPDDER